MLAQPKIGVNEGVQLAALSISGYWLCFVYQVGYSRYFAIPLDLISVGLLQALYAAGALISVAFFVVMLADMSRWFFVSWLPRKYQTRTLVFLFFVGLFSLLALGTRMSWSLALAQGVPLLILVALSLFDRNDNGSATVRNVGNESIDRLTPSLDILFRHTGGTVKAIFLIAYVSSLVALAVGGLVARAKSDFMVLNPSSDMVVLARFDDYLVAARFDRHQHIVYPEYRLIPLTGKPHSLNYERVGPLEPIGLKDK